MNLSRPGTIGRSLRLPLIVAALLAGFFATATPALAEPQNLQWNKYWLPPNYSTHGDEMDWLFHLIFWITTVVFIVVEGVLVVFLIKYRHRPETRKAKFTHGNTRLEMIWTLAPAVVLIVLALMTKRVWDNYRYSPMAEDPNRAKLLVVGEQFKWNVVYPGPDNKLGKYLLFPKPTDPEYRAMPNDQAVKAISNYVAQKNPLGQDPDDPNAKDDDTGTPGRPVIVPVNRSLEINLSAKDVLHDFFLPNFRVKLDAVPGMRGVIHFNARPESQSTQRLPIDDVPPGAKLWIDQKTSGAKFTGNPKSWQIPDAGKPTRAWLTTFQSLEDGARNRIMRRASETGGDVSAPISPEALSSEVASLRSDLRSQYGIEQLDAITKPWEIVCEELCGLGHHTMRNDLIIVSNEQYEDFLHKAERAGGSPSTQPAKPGQVAVNDDAAGTR